MECKSRSRRGYQFEYVHMYIDVGLLHIVFRLKEFTLLLHSMLRQVEMT